ncbi:hypothetical protein [Aeromonas caviae]|uniref:hypothetical protein n=1 Tax=Aeromonas caviae TaxID=648 RepID=UPI00191F70E0|nr:hypothetical protein [Aeromonas caviae]MBL0588230.1 hypothetical protein [Aeromonas caviae]MDY7892799.1 hypothetical protein [Aeromonas caviae]
MGAITSRFKALLGTKLFWLTLLYLLCELAFSASLLELCSREATLDEINQLENVGRLLTGVAISLLFIGMFIDKQHIRPSRRILWSFGLVLLFTGLNHKAQDAFIDHRIQTQFATAEARKGAFLLTLAGRSLSNGTLNLRSIHTPEVLEHKSSVMAFVAIFPALAFNYPNVQDEMTLLLKKAITISVTKPCDALDDRTKCLGSPAQFNNDTWPQIVRGVEERYMEYTRAYNKAVVRTSPEALKQAATDAWDDYLFQLKRAGFTNLFTKHARPYQVPSSKFAQVRQKVREAGVPVPNNWRPTDRKTFEAVVRQKAYRDTWKALGDSMGISNPSRYVTIESFMLLKPVQAAVREQLGVDGIRRIPLVTEFADIERQVYRPIANSIIARLQAQVDSSTARFVGPGPLAEKADSAVKTLVVVPLALLLSLLGGFGHMMKLTTLIFRSLLDEQSKARTLKAMTAAIALVSTGVSALYYAANPLVEAKAYQTFSAATTLNSGRAFSLGLEFIIRLQEFVYPVNAVLLQHCYVIIPLVGSLALLCLYHCAEPKRTMREVQVNVAALQKQLQAALSNESQRKRNAA